MRKQIIVLYFTVSRVYYTYVGTQYAKIFCKIKSSEKKNNSFENFIFYYNFFFFFFFFTITTLLLNLFSTLKYHKF